MADPSIRTYQGIRTKYLGPTNTQPSRIAAVTTSGIRRVWTFSTLQDATGNIGMASSAPHQEACRRLAAEMDWAGKWDGGSLDADTYFWCQADETFAV